jgi:hypothetical protein
VSEWIGWVSRLRRTIYARMEDMSFRTGAATFAGVLAVAATAILLTLIQVGHHAAAPRAAQAGAVPSLPVAAPPRYASLPATHSHKHRAEHFADYVPGPAKTPTATPQASPSPSRPAPWQTPWSRPSATAKPTTPSPGWPSWALPSPPPSQRGF